MRIQQQFRAAWVPEKPDGWDEGLALAAGWIEANAAGTRPVLFTEALGIAEDFPQLRSLDAERVTTRTRQRWRPAPVLAFMPTEPSLELAVRLGARHSICVIESPRLSVRGWAAATAAINLRQPDAPPVKVSADLSTQLDRLKFYSNNGFAPRFDRERAEQILQGWPERLDIEFVAGYMLALGVSYAGVKRLRQFAERL